MEDGEKDLAEGPYLAAFEISDIKDVKECVS